jgi:hypothetical protein
MNRLKEIAKFVCGAEAFHAFIHTYFWLSGTTLHVGWLTENSTVHMWGAIVNAVVSLILGIYAWRASPMHTTLRG